MDWKLFASTFGLIFLAELGDKTQLTAMARATASEHAKWTVFFGASAALIASTLIAVLIGEQLTKLVSPEKIKLGAAILFLVFGLLLLKDALSPKPAEVPAPAEVAAPHGVLADLAFSLAAAFEESAARRYRDLAERAPAELKPRLLALAAEEDAHLAHLRNLAEHHPEERAAEAIEVPPAPPEFKLPADHEQAPLLLEVVRHEKAKADFYETLARQFRLPGLRKAFARLAWEERDHAARVQHLLEDRA